MAFIDEARIHIRAGRGGHGVVRWRHERGKEFAGPSGGNAGRGGDVYMRAVRDINALSRYRNIKEFEAENGQDGMNKSMHGKDGADLTLDVPMGAIVKNVATGKVYQFLEEGQTVKVLEGGRGGLGNEHFKASTNTRPTESTEGKDGEEAEFEIELELLVDAGLAGFPNAGKSSLLNAVTNANVKVGDYAFTTLEPSLGALYGYILADIPGLIEGASEGKGLGTKFLRHIKRTKVVLHCISLEQADIAGAYRTIRSELSKYSPELAKKREILILTKTDLVDEPRLKAAIAEAKELNPEVLSVTILDDASVKAFSDELMKKLRETVK